MMLFYSKSTFTIIQNRCIKCINLILSGNYSLDEDKKKVLYFQILSLQKHMEHLK